MLVHGSDKHINGRYFLSRERRNRMKQKWIKYIIFGLLCVLLVACGENKTEEDSYDTGFIEATPGSYDSMDTAVLVSKNDDETITFMNIETGKYYTLSYTGATTMWDKYGEAMSMAQLKEGDIVDVKFLKEKKRLADISLHSEAFTYTDVTKYEVNELTKTFTIVKEAFQYTDDTVIVSDGQEIELMDLKKQALLKQLVEENKVVRIPDKKKTYFTVASV